MPWLLRERVIRGMGSQMPLVSEVHTLCSGDNGPLRMPLQMAVCDPSLSTVLC